MLTSKIGQREILDDRCPPSVSTYFDEEYLIKSLVRTNTLSNHTGCVNSLQWNQSGTLLASGSDDRTVCIWDGRENKLLHKLSTDHDNNIFAVNFMPSKNDEIILSGSRDNLLQIHHIEKGCLATLNMDTTVRRICTLESDPNVFWVAAEDGFLRQVDMRSNEVDFLMTFPERSSIIKTMAVCNYQPYLMALGLQEPGVPVYDRRIPSRPFLTLKAGDCNFFNRYSTHVEFNTNGTELAVNQSNGDILVFDVDRRKNPKTLQTANQLLDENITNISPITRDMLPYPELRDGTNFLVERSFLRGMDYYGRLMKKREKDARFGSVLHSNRAICLLYRKKQGDNYHCFKECVKALEICQGNSKAIWRMAQCCIFMEDFEMARKCCEVFKKRFPSDQSIRKIENQLSHVSSKSKSRLLTTRHDVMDYKQRFVGHKNYMTDIKQANFFGTDDRFIVAGSDCGGMYIWERESGAIVGVWKGDSGNCNIVQPHPEKVLIATSGFDDTIKLFQPDLNEEREVKAEYGSIKNVYNYIDKGRVGLYPEPLLPESDRRDIPPNCVQS